ncbi:MAG TPA: error-prone DNA polymerase [Puia sp.]|nr:error-prone DNA polymerase [Puia sp.]
MGYAELQVTSNFSFLDGASHPEELVEQAAMLGYAAIAITDRNSFAGIVRAHETAKAKKIRFIPACRLDFQDGPSLLAYPSTKNTYSRLSALITKGNLRTEKGKCLLYKSDAFELSGSAIKFLMVPPLSLDLNFDFEPDFETTLREYRNALGKGLYLAACRRYSGDDAKWLFRLNALSSDYEVPMVATNDIHYHVPQRRELQDALTCIREKCTIQEAGFRLYPNAERYMKTIDEMNRLFRHFPAVIERIDEIVDVCSFSLGELQYNYPEELTTDGRNPQEELTVLVWKGAKEIFGNISEKTAATIRHELDFIDKMNYASYFLTVYDIVSFARKNSILCQGRGSAANSTICFCLGITSVDPTKFDLLFERFISSARNEPPDIDVDFEHERREEVIQYIYQKYGRDRAAIVATVTQERQKGAVRDIGKVMGLSADTINCLSSSIWEFTDEWFEGKKLAEQGLNIDDPLLKKVLQLTGQLMGFPRQLGQHTGGFVITQGKLSDCCPILNARMADRTCIEWNKDDIDALGFLKIDVLALGMLTCIRKAFDLATLHYGLELTLANIPQDDHAVYEMICHADTIGVFQIESRAQQSMLPRLKPRTFYDLVIEVAIVRPGPIQGNMVHPYLKRRNGEEPIEYPSKELEEILGKTLGVPLFQEQAMKIAIVAAGFTPSEADELRRSMATFKAKGQVKQFEDKLIYGMMKRGYDREYACRVFKQLEGFGSYGFPESHAASFALLVYVSSWLKWYYPDVFACALLNSLPMGFYQPAQIVIDAQNHGVEVRPVDINFSLWDNCLENQSGKFRAIRLGFRQVKGLREEDMKILVQSRMLPYSGIHELLNAGISKSTLERIADADAFRSIGLDRRQALWEIAACQDHYTGIFRGQAVPEIGMEKIVLPEMPLSEHVVNDYASSSLSLKAHPVSFVREKLELLRVVPTRMLRSTEDGAWIKVAGLVLVRQRPGTAGGVCFITIEDEAGVANLVVFANLFDTFRKEILRSRLLMAEGRLQREGEVIHVIVNRCHDLSGMLRNLTETKKEDLPLLTLSRADETISPVYAPNIKRSVAGNVADDNLFPKGRNFR